MVRRPDSMATRIPPRGGLRLRGAGAGALLVALLAVPAAALEPLSAEKHINDRLIAARIADRIRRTCPTINGRLLFAYGEARKLRRYAEQKGYSAAQIDAFLDDKSEKARVYAVAEDYLARKGARADDPESFCRLGRQEIANNSIIGSLLVAK
ncbi:DUF5333 domain-containing protein [Paracoccus sp. (in: a-proteobacteria)]|uniref:DUF5333 domain-containing protein n=1 Tax=Paracoccus sp. TaxID=267 RepID=UPI00322077D2